MAIPSLSLVCVVAGIVGSFGVLGFGYRADLLAVAFVAPALVAVTYGALRPGVGVFTFATASFVTYALMAEGPFHLCVELNAGCAEGILHCGPGVVQTCTPLPFAALGLAAISAAVATSLMLWRGTLGGAVVPLGVGGVAGVFAPPAWQFVLSMIVWSVVGD